MNPIAMKTCTILSLCTCLLFAPKINFGQCENGLMTISYDTVLTGGGNNFYELHFPKFDGTLGTLSEVQYTNIVTMKYQFEVENRSSMPIANYRIRIGREDLFMGETIPVPQENIMTQRSFGPYSFAAADAYIGSGPDYRNVGPLFLLQDDTTFSNFYNTADYLGTGNFAIEYYSLATSTLIGDPSISFIGNATDTIHFRMTYVYCPNVVLAADLKTFTAVKQENNILLRWNTVNEENDRTYILEKSYDGRNFITAHRVFSRPGRNATASYQFIYETTNAERGKIIFRLKQVDKDGGVSHSGLRVVQLAENAGSRLIIYPNPARGSAQVLFNNSKRGDWQLEVFSSSGTLVQKEIYKNALTGKINTQGRFSKGMYIVKARNISTNEMFIEKLIVN